MNRDRSIDRKIDGNISLITSKRPVGMCKITIFTF